MSNGVRHISRSEFIQAFNQILGERISGQADQLITQISATQKFVIGTPKDIGPSRYRYGLAGAVNLALGVLCQSPVPGANHVNLVPTASYAIGTTVVTVTLGATGVVANEMAGGWMHVNTGTGQGQNLRILSHPAALAAATCAFTLIDPLTTATDGTSRFSLTPNPYTGAIIHPAPPTARLVGVPVVAITAAYYGWFQTRGPAAVLTDGTLYIHRSVTPSKTTAGAVRHCAQYIVTGTTADPGAALTHSRLILNSAGAEANSAICGTADPGASATLDLGPQNIVVGTVMRVNATTNYSLIWLTLE